MIIHTLWGARKGESTPELMVAWDEYSVDCSREGFDEDCAKAVASWGDDLQEKRYINVYVNEDCVMDAFNEVAIEGHVR